MSEHLWDLLFVVVGMVIASPVAYNLGAWREAERQAAAEERERRLREMERTLL